MTAEPIYLEIKWTVSRARDTYGYNVVTLRDGRTWGKGASRYRALGGGYDMTGTVFGEWLQETYADRLRAIAHRAYMVSQSDDIPGYDRNDGGLYGMYARRNAGRRTVVRLDGSCGLSSMERIAEAIGLTVRHTLDRKGTVTGFIVTDGA